MAVQWTEELATGVDLIDDQHKELFNRINGLLDACRAGKGKEHADKVLHFLEEYVVTHFGMEEKHMQRYEYPAYPAHRAEHLKFMETIAAFKKEVERDGIGVHTVVGINRTVVDWLNNHIRKVDKIMGSYLKEHMK